MQREIKTIKENKTIRDAEIVLGKTLDDNDKQELINQPEVFL